MLSSVLFFNIEYRNWNSKSKIEIENKNWQLELKIEIKN